VRIVLCAWAVDHFELSAKDRDATLDIELLQPEGMLWIYHKDAIDPLQEVLRKDSLA
jgi:hypothetical protein